MLTLSALVSGLLLAPVPPLRPASPASLARAARCAAPACKLDYKAPVVAAEFEAVNALATDDVEEELGESGIVVPPTMNDFEMKEMLVEIRLRKAGKLGSQKAAAAPKKPASYANDFEKAYYEKPAFKALYEKYQKEGIATALNLVTEHLKDARGAKERYGGTENYASVVADIEEALAAKVEQVVTSPRLIFSGFPANMGEAGVRMTLAAFGEVVELSVEESDDGMTCGGRVEYETIDSAKAAIDKYDGVDMGLGTSLELRAL